MQVHIILLSLFCFLSQATASSIRFSPAEIYAGTVKGDLNFPIHANWTLGPVFYLQDQYARDSIQQQSAGARLTYYPQKIDSQYRGYYLSCEWLAGQISAKRNLDDAAFSGKAQLRSLVGILGHRWKLNHRIHLNLGAGFQNSSVKAVILKSSTNPKTYSYKGRGTGSQFSSELSLGYVF